MKPRAGRSVLLCAVLAFALTARADDWMDNLDETLRTSFFKGTVTVQVSGLLDLEGYYIQQPATGLYTEGGNFLFNPRLTINVDAQITPAIYAFVEARIDRGFDPADRDLGARLDQYAISYQPLSQIPIRIQVGKFASVVGTYGERYDSWDNPFINAPLPYENLTPIFDSTVPASASELVYWRYQTDDEYERVPIMWGPDYASGAAVFGQIGDQFDFAAEVKNTPLSARPGNWDLDSYGLDYPTWSGHADWRPNAEWRFGLSASIGPYLRPDAGLDQDTNMPVFPDGKHADDYDQTTVAQDLTWAWHHWQLWAECFETRFDVPRVGSANTLAYYIETKYEFTPQFFGALRWNQQMYSTVPVESSGGYDDYVNEKWGNDIWRIDAALTYRWTEQIQTKLQYSFTDQQLTGAREEHLVAGQLTIKY